jgi:hypothetical protein
MPWFRVSIEGGPVFLRDVTTNVISRLGFFTTRWASGSSAEEASSAACRMVLQDLESVSPENPPDQPVQLKVEDAVKLSVLESLTHPSAGGGFTFFPDDGAGAG